MKKLLTIFLLLLLTVCVAVACNDADKKESDTDGTTTAAQTTDAETTTEAAETDPPALMGSDGTVITDEELHGWLAYGGTQTLRKRFTVETRDTIAIGMAKNEMQGFQYVMAANVAYEGLRCEVSTLTDGQGNALDGTVSVAWTMYTLPSDHLPFALLEQDNEYQGGTFDVEAGCSKTLYIRYITDANTVPGTYTGTLEIKQGDTVLKSHEIAVTVWNIYYDEATEALVPFGFGFSWDYWEPPVPASAPDMREEPEWEFVYADYLLQYRMSPSRLPNDRLITDPIAAKYYNNPRMNFVHLFNINSGQTQSQQEEIAAQYETAKQNGWLDKINIAAGDELTELDYFFYRVNTVKPLFPTTQFGAALLINIPSPNGNIIEQMADYTTVHIVKKSFFSGAPEILESCMRLKEERGDKVLWYVCGDEGLQQIDATAGTPGTYQNILFWQQYLYNIDGLLYWCTNYWEGLPDFWARDFVDRDFSFKEKKEMNYGNGCTFVWDPITGDPVPTMSAEGLRDGIEDFQLMKMAEEVLGKDTVLEYVKRITTSYTEFTKDGELLAQVRAELAEALLAATAQ